MTDKYLHEAIGLKPYQSHPFDRTALVTWVVGVLGCCLFWYWIWSVVVGE
jgi:hypothetical protein